MLIAMNFVTEVIRICGGLHTYIQANMTCVQQKEYPTIQATCRISADF